MYKLQSKELPVRSIWLVGDKVTLGSDKSNDLVIDSQGIDAFHAEIKIEPNCLILLSKPGSCYVNGLSVDAEYELAVNDEILLGKVRWLIVDPKLQAKSTRVQASPTAAVASSVDWVLIPDHPKLKHRDFTIHKPVTLGRSKDCDFSIPYKLLSREHAKLSVELGQLVLIDLASANGCYVNGERVDQAKLSPGDKVSFAKLTFSVQGPVVTSLINKAKSSGQGMNKTIVRPAVNLDGVSDRSSVQDVAEISMSLDIADVAFDQSAVLLTSEHNKQQTMLITVAMLLAITAWLLIK